MIQFCSIIHLDLQAVIPWLHIFEKKSVKDITIDATKMSCHVVSAAIYQGTLEFVSANVIDWGEQQYTNS